MFKKIGQDIYDASEWGSGSAYKRVENRIAKWVFLFLGLGLIAVIVVGLFLK